MLTPPLPNEVGRSLNAVTWDISSSETILKRSDGKQAAFPITPVRGEQGPIRRVTWLIKAAAILIETIAGEQIFVDLPTTQDWAPLSGRPVIYLDQNHWSSLSKSIYSPEKVLADELVTARRLIELAVTGRIVLPISSAHMSETCQWTNAEARYRLALTMLQLSGGWYMRFPVDMRSFEIATAFASRYATPQPTPTNAITLDPRTLYGESAGIAWSGDPAAALPDEVAAASGFMSAVVTNVAVMLDAESVGMNPVPGWVSTNQVFTDWMASERRTREQKRGSTDALLLSDIQREIAQAAHAGGLSGQHLNRWISERKFVEDLAAMPSLGLFRELLHEKAINPTTTWTSNDLTDLMYLSCACGYADLVVAERSAAAKLRNGMNRLGRTVNVFPSLADFGPRLDEMFPMEIRAA